MSSARREARAIPAAGLSVLNNEAMLITPRQPSARVYLALDFVVRLVEIAADIACAFRLVQNQICLCHFGNYFR